ncbi:MAG: GIY-YIG nuclease family protein [Candidatus Roizmanbacteria bacterium]|nr:MAG: GIY-YIG nuclease family protein [Candidatus Roizmanbacteria bacterium]
MFYVYVLLCKYEQINNEFYIGSCKDLKNRYKEHLNKEVKTTKKFSEINLVYYEACLNKTDALIREKQLKTGFGRGYLKRRLVNSLRD